MAKHHADGGTIDLPFVCEACQISNRRQVQIFDGLLPQLLLAVGHSAQHMLHKSSNESRQSLHMCMQMRR